MNEVNIWYLVLHGNWTEMFGCQIFNRQFSTYLCLIPVYVLLYWAISVGNWSLGIVLDYYCLISEQVQRYSAQCLFQVYSHFSSGKVHLPMIVAGLVDVEHFSISPSFNATNSISVRNSSKWWNNSGINYTFNKQPTDWLSSHTLPRWNKA